jgi:hypothetical protein
VLHDGLLLTPPDSKTPIVPNFLLGCSGTQVKQKLQFIFRKIQDFALSHVIVTHQSRSRDSMDADVAYLTKARCLPNNLFTDSAIGLYPLFSCFLNITGAMLDLHTVLNTTYTEVVRLYSVVFILPVLISIELEIEHSW